MGPSPSGQTETQSRSIRMLGDLPRMGLGFASLRGDGLLPINQSGEAGSARDEGRDIHREVFLRQPIPTNHTKRRSLCSGKFVLARSRSNATPKPGRCVGRVVTTPSPLPRVSVAASAIPTWCCPSASLKFTNNKVKGVYENT